MERSFYRDEDDFFADEDDNDALAALLSDDDDYGMRRGIPRVPGMSLAAPSSDGRLDEMLGVDAPELDAYEEQDFDSTPLESFLERLSQGGMPGGLQRPQGFLQGLVSGAAQGAVSRGQRVGERRKKFEEGQVKRVAERDRQNAQATRDYRMQRASAQAGLARETRAERRTQDEYNRKNPPLSPALLEAAPYLGRMFKPGENVPEDVYQGVIKNMSPEAIAEIERKGKAAANDDRRLAIAEGEYGLKKAEAGKPGAGKPPTVAQERAQLFYARAKEAADGALKDGLESYVLNKAWSLQAPQALQRDPKVREYWRAMESFTLALNRLESGANVTPTEFSRVRQLYFVTPGDTAADIKAKAKLRATIVENLWKMQAPSVQQEQAAAGAGPVTPASLWEP